MAVARAASLDCDEDLRAMEQGGQCDKRPAFDLEWLPREVRAVDSVALARSRRGDV